MTAPSSRPPALSSSAHLDVLLRRGEEADAFFDCAEQAREWMQKHGTDALVTELRQARDDNRRVRCGTTNVLILLAHIDLLEAEIAKPPLVKP